MYLFVAVPRVLYQHIRFSNYTNMSHEWSGDKAKEEGTVGYLA
jgi:hypothetical protein